MKVFLRVILLALAMMGIYQVAKNKVNLAENQSSQGQVLLAGAGVGG